MEKMRKWSLNTQVILILMIALEIGGYGLVLASGDMVLKGEGQFAFVLGEMKVSMMSYVSDSWQTMDQELTDNGLNSLYWLSGADVLFAFLLYSLLFWLFTLFRRGQVFSPRPVAQLKRLGILCLLWAGF